MWRLLALAGVLTLLGCRDSTEPAATLEGTYHLVTVNGAPLPFAIVNNSLQKVEILSDVITASTGTVTQSTLIETTVNQGVAVNMVFRSGTYTIGGTAVTLAFPSAAPVTGTGTASGGTLILPISGQISGEARYVRQ